MPPTYVNAPILRLDQYSRARPHILPTGPRVSLEIVRGRVQQRVRQVRGRVFLIGAASDCDLVLGDLQFPEAYAYLFVQDDHITIRRLGTGPELCIGGEMVDSAELFHGDLIAFGPFELRVVVARVPHDRDARLGRLSRPSNEKDLDAALLEVRSLIVDVRRALLNDFPYVQAENLEAGWCASLPVTTVCDSKS